MSEESLTKGERTRGVIEEAAVELFIERGYHATSMRQIANQAGLALSGIYNHFSSKEEIFEAIIIDKHPYKKVLPAILAAEGDNMEEFVRNAFKIIAAEFGEHPLYLNLMFIEFVEFKGKHGVSLIGEIAQKVLPEFERLIKYRKELRVSNPALVLRTFMGMIISYYMTEIVISDSVINHLMPKDVIEAYTDIYLHGIIKETT